MREFVQICYPQLPFFHKIVGKKCFNCFKFTARKKQADKLKKMSSTKADSVETNSVDDDGKAKFCSWKNLNKIKFTYDLKQYPNTWSTFLEIFDMTSDMYLFYL